MTTPDGTDIFYGAIPVFRGFGSLIDPALYSPLPDDWTVGVADIVESTKAIARPALQGGEHGGCCGHRGRHQRAGRPRLSVRVRRRWRELRGFARRPRARRDALAATATWVREDLDLAMRVALVPVEGVREAGLDVRVARFAPSANVVLCDVFRRRVRLGGCRDEAGRVCGAAGGVRHAARSVGLSCRFAEIPSTRGLICRWWWCRPGGRRSAAFRKVIEDIVALVERVSGSRATGAASGPAFRWPTPAWSLKRARRAAAGSRCVKRARRACGDAVGVVVMHFGIRVGNFDPEKYVQRSGRELRLPQVRRRPADDPRLRRGAATRSQAELPANRRPQSGWCATACIGRTRR